MALAARVKIKIKQIKSITPKEPILTFILMRIKICYSALFLLKTKAAGGRRLELRKCKLKIKLKNKNILKIKIKIKINSLSLMVRTAFF